MHNLGIGGYQVFNTCTVNVLFHQIVTLHFLSPSITENKEKENDQNIAIAE